MSASPNRLLIGTSEPENNPQIEPSTRIPRQPPTPADSLLTSLEAMCLQKYRCLPFQMWTIPLADDSDVWWLLNSRNCIFRRFGPNLSAKAVRYSVVLLTARPIENIISLEYLSRCYAAMRDACSRKAFLELVYACFALCTYGMKSSRPWEEISLHLKVFWHSMENVVKNIQLTTEERYWLVYMYYALLHKVAKPADDQLAEVAHFLSSTIVWRIGIIQEFGGTLVHLIFSGIVADKSFGAYSNLLELQLYLRCKLLETNLSFNIAEGINFAIQLQIGILQPCVSILMHRFGLADFDLANQRFLHEQTTVERNLPVPERCLRFLLSFYSCYLEAASLGLASLKREMDLIVIATTTYRISFGIDLGNTCNRTLAFSALFLAGWVLAPLESAQGQYPSPLWYHILI